MGTKSLDVGNVLFGKTRQRVLGLLLGHPDEAYYVREILRRTHGAPGAVQRELELLAGAAVLQRTVRGRQVYFQANRASPIFPDLRNLVVKTFGVVELIREASRRLSMRSRSRSSSARPRARSSGRRATSTCSWSATRRSPRSSG